ncbi:MAG: hypothetical protein JNM43_27085 [Planctomycetaceae bacterium]|nr:hypothetical protein [Planctomycetaceae bacterium]
MDANLKNRQDRIRLQTAAIVLVLFAFADVARGQWVEIRSMDKDQSMIHPVSFSSTAFSEVRWDVHNSYQDDVLIQWTMDAFESSQGSLKKPAQADVGLSVRLRNGGPKNAWHVTQATDRTAILKGDRQATVTAIGTHQGDASFGVTVAFLSPGNSVPAAGRYEARLIGTIAAP